ncbi:MAG: hypothetical protein Q7S36_00335 [Candidatus Liptonbacteria bacterium]|nr:hypothetical protein [Candidatus Liptonbacteria bacterium]
MNSRYRYILIGIFVITILLFGAELRSLWREKQIISREFEEANKQLEIARKERERLEASLQYLSLPENLSKELRAKFHYQLPGEKVMILVPRASSTATSSP